MHQEPTHISIHKCYSEDALELDAILFEPKKKSQTIVIHIHGKEGHFLQNRFVTTVGNAYVQANIAFLTFNNRGHDYVADMVRKTHGGFDFVTKGSAYDLLSESPRDINGVISYVKSLGYTNIFLQGHSLGPHKICYYLTHEPKHQIQGILLLSPSDIKYLFDAYVPHWKDSRAIAEQLLADGKGDELMPLKLWSNALVSVKTYLDWTREDADSWMFNFSDANPICKYFRDITSPMIVVSPENDAAICTPQKEIERILQSCTSSSDFTFHTIKDSPHNFSQKDLELASVLTDWMKKHC